MKTVLIFVVCLIFGFIIGQSPASNLIQQSKETEHDFDYNPKNGRGPKHWGQLKPEWSTCSNGKMQSPIDLPNDRVGVKNHFIRHKKYARSNSTLTNRVHDIMLRWESGGGSIVLHGTEYKLQQIHWHSPSEHTVRGVRFDLEAHMVHESRDGKIAVIGILYKFGLPDPFIASLENHFRAIASDGAKVAVGVTDPNHIKLKSHKYYTYTGSLTVPPCNENILWTILTQVRTVSKEQVALLRVDESKANARPVQPLNNRIVTVFLGS